MTSEAFATAATYVQAGAVAAAAAILTQWWSTENPKYATGYASYLDILTLIAH